MSDPNYIKWCEELQAENAKLEAEVAKLKAGIQTHKRSFTINGSGTKEDMELWTALEEVEK